MVNELVLDPDYDGRPGSPVVDARTAHLSGEDAESVGYSASMVWSETVGKALDKTTKTLVAYLAADPAFEPLPWNEDIDNFAARLAAWQGSALVALVQNQLNQYANERGLIT